MNAGQKTIEWLRTKQLQVDPEWSVSRPNGFTWWPHRHAQHVEVVRDYDGPGGDKGYVIRIRTECLRIKAVLKPSAGVILNSSMERASMAGFVHDPVTGVLYLSSAVRVHEGIWQWMSRLLSVAAMTQIVDAPLDAKTIGLMLSGAISAASDHPSSGPRKQPDEIAASFPSMRKAQGQQPSRWTAREFAQALPLMQRPPSVMASGGGAGVTIEFPYGGTTSLCRIVADEPHPRLGNGLFLLQSFPVTHLVQSNAELRTRTPELRTRALKENITELSEDAKGYGFGSYCYRDGCIHWNGLCIGPAAQPVLLVRRPSRLHGIRPGAARRQPNGNWASDDQSCVGDGAVISLLPACLG
jgi:hypothetical protein